MLGLVMDCETSLQRLKTLRTIKKAKAFVSTAYYTVTAISTILVIAFLIINHFVNWAKVFNTNSNLLNDLRFLLPIIFSFFCLQLVAKLITSIYLADQYHSIQNLLQFITQIISLLAIWLLTKSDTNSLLIYGSIFSAIPVIILIGLNIFAFNGKYKIFKPNYHLWQKVYFKEIAGLGLNFFVIQIAAVILFTSDNFIISNLFGPEKVVPYNVSYKYFSVIIIGYSILITPYWSAFTEAYTSNDIKWIKYSVKSIQKIWILIPIVLLFMIFISNWFYKIWVGPDIVIPANLSISMSIYVLLFTFNMIYVNFINGIGKIKLQLVTSIISMIINIPLSIFIGKYLGWGPTGVILATCFCLFYTVILSPIQYYKLINNKARGIWNK